MKPSTKLFKSQMHAEITQNPDKMRKIVCKLFDMAEGGDLGAIREVIDRVDGKSKLEIENTHTLLADMPDDLAKARMKELEREFEERARKKLLSGNAPSVDNATLN